MPNTTFTKILGGKRQIITLILLLAGVRLWLALPYDQMSSAIEWIALAVGSGFLIFGNCSGRAAVAAAALRKWMGRHRRVTVAAVGMAVCTYLLWQVWKGRTEMFLRIHDEHSYRIQAEMLARGKLWSAAYPPEISPFFDAIHLIVDRVYASIYFPGAALSMVPSIWLRLPYWTSPLACGAAAAAVFFMIARELFGAPRALVAVLMLVSLQFFRWMCYMLMSETAFLLAALILVWAWMRWQRRKGARWAVLIGAAAGWAVITRPLDAACFIAVVTAAILIELRKTPILLAKTAAVIALAALPFAAIQITQDIGVTGKWDQTPMQYYVKASYPGPVMGFAAADMNNLAPGLSAPKRAFAASWIPFYRQHTLKNVLERWYADRFQQIRRDTLPDTDLFILVPLALAAKWNLRRLALVVSMFLIFIAYLAYIFHFDQYLVPVMPAMICIVLMGWEALDCAWPRHRRRIDGFVAAMLVGFSVMSLPEFGGRAWAMPNICEPAKQYGEDLSVLKAPSVVLFSFAGPGHALDWFPVYNDNVPWPDDALVVRANDLGPDQNWKLFRYYARIQPNRRVYQYVRSSANDPHTLRYLGTCAELANRRP